MKITNISFLLLFIFAILLSTLIVNKYDKYEISSDYKNNHTMIKGDAYKYWNEAQEIKKQNKNEVPFYKLGLSYYQSFLPPKLISAFYIVTSEDLFLNEYTDDNRLKVKSNNKKNYFFNLQIITFFISLLILLRSLKKNYFEISIICIFF